MQFPLQIFYTESPCFFFFGGKHRAGQGAPTVETPRCSLRQGDVGVTGTPGRVHVRSSSSHYLQLRDWEAEEGGRGRRLCLIAAGERSRGARKKRCENFQWRKEERWQLLVLTWGNYYQITSLERKGWEEGAQVGFIASIYGRRQATSTRVFFHATTNDFPHKRREINSTNFGPRENISCN